MAGRAAMSRWREEMLAIIVLDALVDGFAEWIGDDPDDEGLAAVVRELARRQDASDLRPGHDAPQPPPPGPAGRAER
jgi:hypothetical protein